MKNELVKKDLFSKELGKNVAVTIYPEAQTAIDKGWESLYFPDNLTDFGDVIVDGYIVSLGTYGEVRLLPEQEDIDIEYKNDNVEEIRDIINQGKLEDYTLDNNNWFAVVIGKIISEEDGVIQYETIDDMVFEACPKTIEELEKELVEYTVSLIEHYVPEIINKAE